MNHQTVSFVGDLMMFNEVENIFTFIYFENLVSSSGDITFKFVWQEPFAQGLWNSKVDIRFTLIGICFALIVIYIIREVYSFCRLHVDFRNEEKAARSEDSKLPPGTRKLRVNREVIDVKLINM